MFRSSRGGLGVERWSDNRLHSVPVDRIPLGETIPAISMFYVYMVPTPTDMCYKYKLAERLLVLRDIAPQTNPDSLPRSKPALEQHSRAASSVGVMSPFQQS